jgi:hypothetical protein
MVLYHFQELADAVFLICRTQRWTYFHEARWLHVSRVSLVDTFDRLIACFDCP